VGDRRKYDDLRKLYSGITAGLLSISTAHSGQWSGSDVLAYRDQGEWPV